MVMASSVGVDKLIGIQCEGKISLSKHLAKIEVGGTTRWKL